MRFPNLPLLLLLIASPLNLNLEAEALPEIDWEELNQSSPWQFTEVYQKVPVVAPAENGAAPSDAVALFDGTDLSRWQKTSFGEGLLTSRTELQLKTYLEGGDYGPADWPIENGEIVSGQKLGSIATKQAFGDMQLHIEWFVPALEGKQGQKYGNSGIFLMGMYEIQILNSFENETYSNGQAASVYKQLSPMVNASRPPGQWQSYDILFTAPRFADSGAVIHPATVTILHNGVLVQYNSVLQGPTSFIGQPYYFAHPEKLPIVLQDHDNPVRFRNIWVREL